MAMLQQLTHGQIFFLFLLVLPVSIVDESCSDNRKVGTINTCSPALEEVMENFAELMQRLLEIQSGGRARRPEVVVEHERLMDRLQKRDLARRLPRPVEHTQDRSERTRLPVLQPPTNRL